MTHRPHPRSALARHGMDRTTLVANLGSGTLLLAAIPVLNPDAWVLLLIGAAYVAAASCFLSYVCTRPALTWTQEAIAWAVPWMAAAALWMVLLVQVEGGTSGASAWMVSAWFGFVVATPCYLVWQAVALAVRQLLRWQSGRATPRPCLRPTP